MTKLFKNLLARKNQTSPNPFIRASNRLIPVARIRDIELSGIEAGWLSVKLDDNEIVKAIGIDVIDALMIIRPSVLEGKRFQWAKNAWWLHNAIGHPIMQLMSWAGFTKQAIAFHDMTVPKPLGFKYGPKRMS